MKHLATLLLVCFCITACKKEIIALNKTGSYVARIKTALADSMEAATYATLDFENAVLSEVDSIHLHLVRIPFSSREDSTTFILVKGNDKGDIVEGKVIHLTRTPATGGFKFEGRIELYTLQKKLLLASAVTNGFIAVYHSEKRPVSDNIVSLIQPVQPAALPVTELPEVIVVASYPPSGGISYSEWLSVQGLFGNNGGGGGGGSNGSSYYSPVTGTSGGGGSTAQIAPLEVEKEYTYTLPGIDIVKLFRCFDYVPSEGATYTIKLCADLPMNSKPYASTNYSSVSGGHSFLVITKSNGGISVTQSFGFYPQTAPSWYDPFSPIASSLRSNGAQEINASIEMNIDESKFNMIKRNAIAWSTQNYSLADYNCTNYALEIFNSVRPNPIIVAPYKVILSNSPDPYNMGAEPVFVFIDKSPQTLFSKLRELKSGNSSEATHIIIDQSHNLFAPISKGECN